MAHHNQSVYNAKSGVSRGNTWLMNRASITALPACKEGKAPNTMGDPVKPGVYSAIPKSLSIAANPAGEPGIE